MKKFIALLLMCATAFAGTSVVSPPIHGVLGISYFFSERLEPGGYQRTWTETGTGTLDEDYTGVILEGTQSLRIAAATQSPRTSATFNSDLTEAWGFFRFQIVTPVTANRLFFVINDSTAALVFSITLTTTNTLTVRAGNANSAATSALTTGTAYNMWWHWKKGTGANAQGSVGFSTGTTEITSGATYTSITTGTAVTDLHTLLLGFSSNGIGEFIIDQVLISNTATVGNNPL